MWELRICRARLKELVLQKMSEDAIYEIRSYYEMAATALAWGVRSFYRELVVSCQHRVHACRRTCSVHDFMDWNHRSGLAATTCSVELSGTHTSQHHFSGPALSRSFKFG